MEDADEPCVLLIALRHVAQAQGIAKIAKAAGVERESLYRALSANGNPHLSTLFAVAKSGWFEAHHRSRLTGPEEVLFPIDWELVRVARFRDGAPHDVAPERIAAAILALSARTSR